MCRTSKTDIILSPKEVSNGEIAQKEACPLCPARHSRFAGRGYLQRKGQSSQKNMVVAFDINGVLLHDDKITPESRRVRELLNGDNELGIKIPYMLLTNGSGKTEALPSPPHSPSNPTRPCKLVPNRVSRPALPQRRTDSKTSSSQDTLAWGPSISPPWRNFTEKDHKQARPQDFDNVTFHSILVFADSRDSCDYATNFQITMELLLRQYHLPNRPQAPADDPRSLPHRPRNDVQVTHDGYLERVVYAKPELATYKFADGVTMLWMKEIHNEHILTENIYMIGGNPASDIIGGTGVFQANFGVFDTMLDGVQAAVQKELSHQFKLRWGENEGVKSALNGDIIVSA
ncbi:CDP-alcohol phosphatidyltransferase [Histoplasma capsulatum G186AR]|uniref:CDP-alcohol phosphatidyltransferase n=1 Tax=Ajellomyces capsulatus (strain G186AR / H82 / ATCC MYA-2454 / RMSCC 2432) TaxID=447093 RepID=C0NJP8_AJECG|nr:CDP-alcohol phosphatidyltransferase [Histoplasma capsulatum G186AR]EEH08089.1 CDP-alcohol phosphatidyltransferase [Histoplasma capsulatum G186AR]